MIGCPLTCEILETMYYKHLIDTHEINENHREYLSSCSCFYIEVNKRIICLGNIS